MTNQIGFICIMTEIGKEEAVTEATKKVEGVMEAYTIYGPYDIVARITAKDTEALKDIVQRQIRQIPNIRSTITFPVVE